MRPVYHPALSDITVEGILHALSNSVRVQIFSDIARGEHPQNCSKFLMVNNQQLPKSTLSQHFRILREAGLIRSERSGVELHNSTRCTELKPLYGTMVTAIVEAYIEQQKRAGLSGKKRA
ncbi:MAG: ArsR/SmtB family transcription factor [Rickettsiales bacterium]